MDHKDNKFKPGRLRSVIAGAALAASSGMAMAGATSPAAFELDMTCPFPLVGDTDINVKGTASIPARIPSRGVASGVEVNVVATVPGVVTKAINLLNAPATTISEVTPSPDEVDSLGFPVELVAKSDNPLNKISGSAIANVSIIQGNGALTKINLPITLDDAFVPQDGTAMALTGAGISPNVTFLAPGEASIDITGINLSVGLNFDDGTVGPAPLDSFESVCDLTPESIAKVATCGNIAVCDLDVEHPRSLEFGFVANGSTATETASISVASAINAVSIVGDDASAFSQVNNCTNGADSCSVDVTYTPSAMGEQSAKLVLNTNVWIALNGTGVDAVEPKIEFSSSSVDFGTVQFGRQPIKFITATNNGYADATGLSFDIDSDAFEVGPAFGESSCTDLAIGESCEIKVLYNAAKPGESAVSDSATLSVLGSSVSLNGATGEVTPGTLYGLPLNLDMACFFPLIDEAGIRVTGSTNLPAVGVAGRPLDEISIEIQAVAEETIMNGGALAGLNFLAGYADAHIDMVISGVGTVPLTVPIELEYAQVPYDLEFDGILYPTYLYAATTIPVNLTFDEGEVKFNLTGITLRARGYKAPLDESFIPIFDGTPIPLPTTPASSQYNLLVDDCNSVKTISGEEAGYVSVFEGEQFKFTPFTVQTLKICSEANAESECGIIVGTDPGEIDVSPTALTFGPLDITDPASTKVVTIANTGPGVLTLNSTSVTGTSFTKQSTTCGATIAAGASCTVTVAFDPETASDFTGSLTISSDDADEGTVTVALSGKGTEEVVDPAELSVSTTALDFGTVVVGETADLTVTVSNSAASGAEALEVTGVTIGGKFTESNNCSTVVAGSSCDITVTYTPTAEEADTSTLSIATSAGNADVGLSGAGDIIEGVISAPASQAFGSQTVGASSTQIITVTNSGDGDLEITGATTAAPFAVTNNACGTVAPAGTCEITVTYTASVVGAESGSLSITSSAGDASVALTGTGVELPVPDVSVDKETVAFGSVEVGTTKDVVVTITSSGQAELVVSSVSTEAPFSVVSDCGTEAPGETCTATVTFEPTAEGAASGTLTIASNADEVTVDLSGTGTLAPELPEIEVSPLTVDFDELTVGESATATVTVANVGGLDLTVSDISFDGGDFTATDCTTIAGGATCEVTVTFTPAAAGAQSATMTISSNDADEATVPVAVSGSAKDVPPEADISVAPESVDFGDILSGATSAAVDVTVSNVGGSDLIVNGASISGANADAFTIVSDNCATVAAGGTCTISLTYTASGDNVAQTASLDITSTDSDEATVSVDLKGFSKVEVADKAEITAVETTLDFGAVEVSKELTATFKNVGEAPFSTANIELTGDSAFTLLSNDCTTLASGESCTATVSFMPTAEGAVTANLTITGTDGSATVALTGQLATAVTEFDASFSGKVDFASGLMMAVQGNLAASINDQGVFSDAALTFASTKFNARLGFLPIEAKVDLVADSVTGSYVGGSATVDTTVSVKLPLIYVKLFGLVKIPVGGGASCGTTDASSLLLTGDAAELSGSFTLSNFTNCGPLTSALTRSLSGGTNNINVALTVQ